MLFSWPGTCLDDSWINPPNLTPSSPKHVRVQLNFSTQHGELVPVLHIEWTLQTDGEWPHQPGLRFAFLKRPLLTHVWCWKLRPLHSKSFSGVRYVPTECLLSTLSL